MLTRGENMLGWTGKLPCRGDFISGGAKLQVFQWFEGWASEGMVAVRDGGGPAADAFLTSDLRRLAASSRVLGPNAVMAVIGPGMDRAARLYPFMLALELAEEIAPTETLAACSDWFEQLEEMFLTALAPDFDPDRLHDMTRSTPAPQPVKPVGLGRVFAHQIMGGLPVAEGAAPALSELFDSAPPGRPHAGVNPDLTVI